MQNEIGSSIITTQIRRLTAGAAIIAVAFGLLLANPAFAQGMPTATLSGKVTNDALDLPGVSVTAKSPNLQGTRATVTGASGDYIFANVPPGEYTITFTLSGFQTQTKPITLASSQASRLDTNMSLTTVSTTLTVSGKSDSISQASTEATTYTADLLTKLPTARTITSAVLLSPGINNNGPNGVSIAGAMSVENLYTVNGVVITDNVRNTPRTLFIEDAIQETTTMTSSVTSEYGRFTGGVINTITKSGGNAFSGSVRAVLTNDSWRATNAYRDPTTGTNPQEGTFLQKVVPTYELTFGGPILKDRLWFFAAGRTFDTSDANSTITKATNIPVTYGQKETRYEGKLTLSPFQNHTLTGSYIGIERSEVNYWAAQVAPPADINQFYDRKTPESLLAVSYTGVLTNSLFVDAFYSNKKFTFKGAGGKSQDLIAGTPIRDVNRTLIYNAAYFCGVCSDETRDNNDYVIKGTYFLSTPSLGSHNIVAGYDDFGGQRNSNNYQSGSNYVVYSPYASVVKGTDIYPVFDANTYVVYWPILQLSQGNDLRTRSAFVNDTWRLSNRLSFNLGVRYDKNHATDQGGNVTSNDTAWSPRLAAILDVKGDGKLRVTGSYAKYVSALQDTQAGSGATLAGSPAVFYWYYGDMAGFKPINTDPTKPLLSPADALQQFFNTFGANGCQPNPLAASCTTPQGGPPSISGVNVQIQGSLASPNADEYVLGLSGSLGSRGTFRADVVRRQYHDFYDLLKDTSTGTVPSPVNPAQRYDLGLIVNSNDYTRNYTGLHTQVAYRLGRLNLGGVWTWSHLIGDLVGETAGSSVVRAGLHAYPEYFDRKWNSPVGSLSSDTRHRVRVWGTYDLPVPASFGSLNISAIQGWDTGTPYGANGTVRTAAYVTNPGYLTPPASVGYWFTGRDTYRLESVYSTDLALTFSHKIAGTVEIWVAPQVYNIFNAQHITAVNTTVNTNFNSSSLVAFNPFTTASPVECPQGTALATCKTMGANYQKGAQFGTPTTAGSYQPARTFQVAVGVRF